MQTYINHAVDQLRRIRLWYAMLLLVLGIFVVRLFYLQIIRHNYYQKVALSDQLKQYQIPAERGTINAHDGSNTLPIVLNEKLYTLFVDPVYVKDAPATALDIAKIIGGNAADYEKRMHSNTRYEVLAKKLNKDQKDKLDALNAKGVGTREEEYRTYPQNQLAAQLLGFVNDDGQGKYGVEQYLDSALKGTPGQLKAITDAQGVPLVSNKDNIVTQPKNGDQVLLTIDISMQQQLEDILKQGLDAAKSTSGGALILDTHSGAIRAMASYPTYNPSEFYKVSDVNLFNNTNVSSPLEVGSVMKPLTMAAAFDQGVANPSTTYYDPSQFKIGDATIHNIVEDGGPGVKSMNDILQLSLNTGATWLLMQMGGGQINEKARVAWHDYMVNHYQFGKDTGVEQGYESAGQIPDPINGFGLEIQYANTTFGQGLAITPLQLGAALASVVNGGTYYRPYLVDSLTDTNGVTKVTKPQVIKSNVVKPEVSSQITSLMRYVISKNYLLYGLSGPHSEYVIGGKTGTAQISKPSGGYYDDRDNGVFMGFIGSKQPDYVIVVRVNEPHVSGYSGPRAAGPIFAKLTDMLINNFGIAPNR